MYFYCKYMKRNNSFIFERIDFQNILSKIVIKFGYYICIDKQHKKTTIFYRK